MSDTKSDTKSKPIYLVIHKPTGVKRLVRANNINGALRFVAEDTLEARRPTQDELIANAGAKVEEATS